MGQVIGESTAKAEVPKSAPIYPKDVMATIFHALGLDQQKQMIVSMGQFLGEEVSFRRDAVAAETTAHNTMDAFSDPRRTRHQGVEVMGVEHEQARA